MCGIAGIYNFTDEPVDAAELRRMTDSLRHRGPDGEGQRISGRCGLGHRRLAIIDLAGGAQPLSNEDGTVWVTFNGEIYNFGELRGELEKAGHRFRTHSDTEAIVHAYEEWGDACVERFRGMFAFAIHDERTDRLFLARDRLGIKPLCYWHDGQRLLFASELQAFQTVASPPRRLDPAALDLYLEHLYIPAPWTIFAGVKKLPPGHTLTVSQSGKLSLRKYWQVRFAPGPALREEEWLEELDATLLEAVRLHLIADVPVGAFLSGGIDSGVVTAYMARLLSQPARTFCIGHEDAEYNEAPVAREVSAHLKTIHTEEVVRPEGEEGVRILGSLMKHYGEPFADSSAVPTCMVSRLARKQVTVALSGDGGDEAFAGYPWVHGLLRQFVFPPRTLVDAMKAIIRRPLGSLGVWPERTDPLRLFRQARSCFVTSERQKLWRKHLAAGASDRPSQLQVCEAELQGLDLCSQLQALDYSWYLSADILAKVDVASMYHSLEVRVPLLDHKVVELAGRMPWSMKIRPGKNGETGRVTSKYALRKIAQRVLPKVVLDRGKYGFALPLHRWMSGADSQCLSGTLLDPAARLTEVFEADRLKLLLEKRPLRGRDAQAVWSLMVLGDWFRQHPGVEV